MASGKIRFGQVAQTLGAGATRRGIVQALAVGAVAAGTATRPLATRAQEATPAADTETCPTTTLEENKALVALYWNEVWTKGGESAIANILAPDELHHWGVGDDTVGHDAFAERLGRFLTAFPDFAVRLDQTMAEGDLVLSRWTATATQTGAWLGIAPTGAKVEYTGMNVLRIACGKIAEAWGEADHLGLLRQLGGVPEVATPTAENPSA